MIIGEQQRRSAITTKPLCNFKKSHPRTDTPSKIHSASAEHPPRR